MKLTFNPEVELNQDERAVLAVVEGEFPELSPIRALIHAVVPPEQIAAFLTGQGLTKRFDGAWVKAQPKTAAPVTQPSGPGIAPATGQAASGASTDTRRAQTPQSPGIRHQTPTSAVHADPSKTPLIPAKVANTPAKP